MRPSDAEVWLGYAASNLGASEVVFKAGYYNPALQEAQQAVEKAMKAMVLKFGLPLKKTHSIRELKALLQDAGVDVCISIEESHLLDSIYIPSKYPLGSCLPDSEPDVEICRKCIEIAKKVYACSARII